MNIKYAFDGNILQKFSYDGSNLYIIRQKESIEIFDVLNLKSLFTIPITEEVREAEFDKKYQKLYFLKDAYLYVKDIQGQKLA